jgi:hypothetical protein
LHLGLAERGVKAARGGVDEAEKALVAGRIERFVSIRAILCADVNSRRVGQALAGENVVELLPIVAREKDVVADEREAIDSRTHGPRQG